MTILVLAGSPKGEISITMQYVQWLEQKVVAQKDGGAR